jgi:periplasmic protein CpxP/Spy
MNKLVKLGMALGVATILHSTTAFAQKSSPKHNKENHQEMRAQRFTEASKRLNLTDDQQAKIKELLSTNKSEMKALREKNKAASKDEKRAAMMAQLKKLDTQISEVLTGDQQKEYAKMKEERKEAMKAKRAEKMRENEEMEEYQGIF